MTLKYDANDDCSKLLSSLLYKKTFQEDSTTTLEKHRRKVYTSLIRNLLISSLMSHIKQKRDEKIETNFEYTVIYTERVINEDALKCNLRVSLSLRDSRLLFFVICTLFTTLFLHSNCSCSPFWWNKFLLSTLFGNYTRLSLINCLGESSCHWTRRTPSSILLWLSFLHFCSSTAVDFSSETNDFLSAIN